MATERVTLGDIRAVAKIADGIRIGGWVQGDPNNPLPEAFQEMADDITKWFNPDQGWQLAEVRTGFISPQRMAESVTEDSVIKFRAKAQLPDQFTPVFKFQAERPPMRAKGIVRRSEILDFPQVFAPDFRERVDIWRDGSADVTAPHIGQIYPLEQALKVLSSPYYLVGATISLSSRQPVPSTVFELQRQREASIKPEAPRDLTIMVYARDLMDYTRLEVNKLRRIQRQLDRKFPPLQPAPSQESVNPS
jgi:hypothetical protein